MTSLVCGLAAACCWAGANLLAARVTRDPDVRDFAFWSSLFGVALGAPLGIALLPSAHVSLHDVLALALAGTAAGIAVRLLATALAHGQLTVVGPLQSLEGAVAAALAIAFAGQVDGAQLVGGLLAVAGSVTVGVAAARRGHLVASAGALPVAALGGVALWLFAQQTLAPLVAFAIVRAFAALTLAPQVTSWRPPPRARAMLAVAAVAAGGDLFYLLGARAESLAVTAVLASQFGVLTALGGVWHWHESLGRAQIAGLLVLGAGVAVIAAASA
jgi:drug/metabolite transporter (DMT)-like permease